MPWDLLTIAWLFGGLFIGADAFVVPYALHGGAGMGEYTALAGIAVLATALFDTIWFCFGKMVSYPRLARLPLLVRHEAAVAALRRRFCDNFFWVVFISEFLYGARAAAQFMAGASGASYTRSLAAGILGSVTWLISLIALHRFIFTRADALANAPFALSLTVLIFLGAALALHALVVRFVRGSFIRP